MNMNKPIFSLLFQIRSRHRATMAWLARLDPGFTDAWSAVVFALLTLALLAASCVPGEQVSSTGISVWHDDRHHVTCWLYVEPLGKAGGISCLPDSEVMR